MTGLSAEVDQLVASLRHDGADTVLLGGSRGRDDADEFSDVDLVVAFDPNTPIGNVTPDRVASWMARTTIVHLAIVPLGTVTLVNLITEDWQRIDVAITNIDGLSAYNRFEVVPLHDPNDRADQLAVRRFGSPNENRLEPLTREFLRVVGLSSVVIARKEFVVASTGIFLLRNMLIELMKLAGEPRVERGMMSLRKALDPADYEVLMELGLPTLDRVSLIQSHRRFFDCFVPRARYLAHEWDIAFPDEFLASVDAKLRGSFGEDWA